MSPTSSATPESAALPQGPAGDPRLAQLYRTHRALVLAVCRTYLDDRAAAEDATQETFIRVSRSLSRIDDARLVAYLVTVARNVCRDELAARRFRRRASERLHQPEVALDPAELVAEQTLAAQVWSALGPRDRTLLLLRLAGFRYEEIARQLGVSLASVRMGLLHARQRARRSLERMTAGLLGLLLRRRCGRRGARTAVAFTATTSWLGTALAWGGVAVLGGLSAAVLVPHHQVARAEDGASRNGALAAAAGGAELPSQVRVETIAVSPDYTHDHTVYAAGGLRGCAQASCSTLDVSHDSGRSWNALPAAGFRGGRLIATAGPLLFAAGPLGLQRSDDGGASFRSATPLHGPAALLPGAPGADVTVVIGTQPLRLYHAHSEEVTDAVRLPGAGVEVVDVAALDGSHTVAVTTREAGGWRVLRCDLRAGCGTVLAGAADAPLRLVRSATFDRDHTLLAIRAGEVAVSRDSGATFTRLPLGHGATVSAATAGSDDQGMPAILADVAPAGAGPGDLLMRWRGGAPGARISADPDRTIWLQALPDGRVLRAFERAGDGGLPLACSDSGGLTWQARC